MPTFEDLGVRSDVVTRLRARSIIEPFPIQAATIADALAGRDVCGRAPTGSGKTIAFGIPLVENVGKAAPRQPHGLVLVPTRELANQVAEELRALAGPKARIATVYGGVGYGDQLRNLRRGADIVVACPGRLKDLIDRNEMRLDDVGFVVIDEADRMADMGFLPEVRRILDQVREDRQTLLFSATLDGDINTLIERYQNDPVRHEVAKDEDAPENVHMFWKTHRNERVELLANIVKAEWPAVVFCRTKHGTDRLAEQLVNAGVSAVAIHGDRSQSQRERALRAFTIGKAQCLVATDVAARGIHVDAVACVVHFDPPSDDKDYIHRSGRTGRAGAAGLVLSLVTPDQVKLTQARSRRLDLGGHVGLPDLNSLNTEFRAAPVFEREKPQPKFEKPKYEGKRDYDAKPKYEKKRDFDKPSYAAKPKWDAKPKQAANGRYETKPTWVDKGDHENKGKYGDKPSYDAKPKFEKKRDFDKPKWEAKPKFGEKSKFGEKPKYVRADGSANTAESTKPKRLRKPHTATAGAQRPTGTGHPKARKPHRKGGSQPGGVGGVRRATKSSRTR